MSEPTLGQICSELDDKAWKRLPQQSKVYWENKAHAFKAHIMRIHPDEHIKEMKEGCDELNATFDLMYKAHARGVELWTKAHPEQPLTWPSTDRLVEWLISELTKYETALRRIAYEKNVSEAQSNPDKNPLFIAKSVLNDEYTN